VTALLVGSALLSGCGDDEPGADPPTRTIKVELDEPAAEEPADAPDAPAARGRRVLALPEVGNPLVQVRSRRHVELYNEPRGDVIETVRDETEFGSPTAFAVQRDREGWAAVPTPHFENGRLAWLRLDPRNLKAYTVHYEVEIDLSDYRVDLLRRDEVVHSFTVSVGSPETPTPTGRFAVTDTFRGGLNPVYGCCAVALTARQTRLPSGWLGGDRIAIHGTSGPLGAAISNGCVRATNADVSELVDRLPPGTPVTIHQ
jgi:hypothetical protein